MEELPIKYSQLREVSESIISFLDKEFWWEEDANFKSSIENDFGITGDDAVELLEKFAEKFEVDFSEFNFEKYFSPEGVSGSPLVALSAVVLFILFLGKLVVSGGIYFFNKETSKKVFNFSLTKLFNSLFDEIGSTNLESFTVEDLITTAIKGRFTKRETVKFVLIK